MVPHIFASPMREKEKTFVSGLFYIAIFPKVNSPLWKPSHWFLAHRAGFIKINQPFLNFIVRSGG
jgi:hypothetical protein